MYLRALNTCHNRVKCDKWKWRRRRTMMTTHSMVCTILGDIRTTGGVILLQAWNSIPICKTNENGIKLLNARIDWNLVRSLSRSRSHFALCVCASMLHRIRKRFKFTKNDCQPNLFSTKAGKHWTNNVYPILNMYGLFGYDITTFLDPCNTLWTVNTIYVV